MEQKHWLRNGVVEVVGLVGIAAAPATGGWTLIAAIPMIPSMIDSLGKS